MSQADNSLRDGTEEQPTETTPAVGRNDDQLRSETLGEFGDLTTGVSEFDSHMRSLSRSSPNAVMHRLFGVRSSMRIVDRVPYEPWLRRQEWGQDMDQMQLR